MVWQLHWKELLEFWEQVSWNKSVYEIQKIEIVILRCAQHRSFEREILYVSEGGNVTKGYNIVALDP